MENLLRPIVIDADAAAIFELSGLKRKRADDSQPQDSQPQESQPRPMSVLTLDENASCDQEDQREVVVLDDDGSVDLLEEHEVKPRDAKRIRLAESDSELSELSEPSQSEQSESEDSDDESEDSESEDEDEEDETQCDERVEAKCVRCGFSLMVDEAEEAYDRGWVMDNGGEWNCDSCYTGSDDEQAQPQSQSQVQSQVQSQPQPEVQSQADQGREAHSFPSRWFLQVQETSRRFLQVQETSRPMAERTSILEVSSSPKFNVVNKTRSLFLEMTADIGGEPAPFFYSVKPDDLNDVLNAVNPRVGTDQKRVAEALGDFVRELFRGLVEVKVLDLTKFD